MIPHSCLVSTAVLCAESGCVLEPAPSASTQARLRLRLRPKRLRSQRTRAQLQLARSPSALAYSVKTIPDIDITHRIRYDMISSSPNAINTHPRSRNSKKLPRSSPRSSILISVSVPASDEDAFAFFVFEDRLRESAPAQLRPTWTRIRTHLNAERQAASMAPQGRAGPLDPFYFSAARAPERPLSKLKTSSSDLDAQLAQRRPTVPSMSQQPERPSARKLRL
ncbi:hypothetical protein DFH09DRAFT_1490021 [Mycena vulgaris]|nr:hypothetical protein DFH09DRAFT_1490021 [Mycena vulgaris]